MIYNRNMKVLFQDEVSVAVLFIELLMILSINSGSRTAADKWEYINSGPKIISNVILKPLLMTFSVVVKRGLHRSASDRLVTTT
jgi:hypothetical protein